MLLWSHIFNLVAIAIFALMGYIIYFGREGSILLFFSAVTCLFFANIKHLKRFKVSASGVDAEMQEIINQGWVAVDSLKDLAKTHAQAILPMLSIANDSQLNSELHDKLASDIVNTLKKTGVTESEINKILDLQIPYNKFKYVDMILRNVPDSISFEKLEPFLKKYEGIHVNNAPDANALEEFLDSLGILDQQIRELIEDYRYYSENHYHRRLDVWRNRR